ncbi:glycosyltransferase family 2 protein [Flavobacterium sp. LB1P62]|uniref:glycosyltransferase family 2 protein n=1 Tax=Flavobacterium sp. LB1P62 TaxID=3401715 RepID=UPI003AAA6D11
MNRLVSIIIPTYNRAHLIEETLDSVLAQTYANWECIIIDDGSTDNTLEVISVYLKKDKRFQYYPRPVYRSKGPNVCRNYGFELSKGEFINWFDSDDVMLPTFLEKQICSFGATADMSVCKLVYFDFDKGIGSKVNIIFSNNLIEDYLTGKIKFYTFTPVWAKKFLNKQVELFDETITNLDDWDFNLRMLYQSPKIVFREEVLIKYRVHENSLSQEIRKLNFDQIKSEFKAREKHLKLIKSNKKVNYKVLENSNIKQYKFILREAIIANNDNKFFYFKYLLIKQLRALDIYGIFKSLFGFVVYGLFKKGYKLL